MASISHPQTGPRSAGRALLLLLQALDLAERRGRVVLLVLAVARRRALPRRRVVLARRLDRFPVTAGEEADDLLARRLLASRGLHGLLLVAFARGYRRIRNVAIASSAVRLAPSRSPIGRRAVSRGAQRLRATAPLRYGGHVWGARNAGLTGTS